MKACGLSSSRMPSRRTFDRQLKTLSNDVRGRISIIGNLFVFEGLVKPYVVAIDSALLRSKGHVWHTSSMKEGIVPRSGIDTDARWGFSHTKGWIFGYKLHMVSSTDSTIVPLVADVTTANVSDKPVYPDMVSGLYSQTIKKIHYMVADPGYDDHELYDLSTEKGFQLVCPVHRYRKTPEERLKLVDFYQSALGQVIYSKRSTSIEPLIEHIKSVFRIDPLPIKGYDKVRSILSLSILLYQILVYYNYKTQKEGSIKSIKYLIGS